MVKTKDGREYVMEPVYRCKFRVNEEGLVVCSNCGWQADVFNPLSETPEPVMQYKYCPCCGAKITNSEFLIDYTEAFRAGFYER